MSLHPLNRVFHRAHDGWSRIWINEGGGKFSQNFLHSVLGARFVFFILIRFPLFVFSFRAREGKRAQYSW